MVGLDRDVRVRRRDAFRANAWCCLARVPGMVTVLARTGQLRSAAGQVHTGSIRHEFALPGTLLHAAEPGVHCR